MFDSSRHEIADPHPNVSQEDGNAFRSNMYDGVGPLLARGLRLRVERIVDGDAWAEHPRSERFA